MEIDFAKISKEELKNNFFIVRVGTDDRPATDEDLDSVSDALDHVGEALGLDFELSVLITHHGVTFESIPKEELRKTLKE